MKIAIEEFLKKQNINDDSFYSSLIAELEEIIEEELSKDIEEMNAELIDDCCIAIESLQNALNGEVTEKFEAFSGVERIFKQYNRRHRNIYVASVACAAVTVLCAITSVKLTNQNAQGSLKPNSFLDDVFNIYTETIPESEITEKEYTTQAQKEEQPTFITNEPTTAVSQMTENQVTEEIIPPSTMPIPHIYNLEVIIPPGDTMNFKDISEINLSGVFVKVYYSDNTEKIVSVDECDVDIGTPDENGKTKVTITYNHMYTSIYVNIGSKNETTSE